MKTDQTYKIEAILLRYHSQLKSGERAKIIGFHDNLGKRFGISKGRISNIARALGLTGRRPRGEARR